MGQYVLFTKIYKEQVAIYDRTRKAVIETIRICKNRDVLKEYLESRGTEVMDIMMTLFDQEKAMEQFAKELRAEAIEEGRRGGIEEGIEKGIANSAQQLMKSMKVSLSQALNLLGVVGAERIAVEKLINNQV